MSEQRIRADYQGFAFPKFVRMRGKKKAKRPEAVAQGQVNALGDVLGIPYLRLPESLFVSIFASPSVPIHVKRHLKDAIAGWADNIFFLPVSDRFALACFIECKNDVGKLHGMQKTRSRELPYNIIREQADAQELLMDFKSRAETMRRIFKDPILLRRVMDEIEKQDGCAAKPFPGRNGATNQTAQAEGNGEQAK